MRKSEIVPTSLESKSLEVIESEYIHKEGRPYTADAPCGKDALKRSIIFNSEKLLIILRHFIMNSKSVFTLYHSRILE